MTVTAKVGSISSAEYAVTGLIVTAGSGGGEGGGETKAWKLVTDASTLAAGDQLIIVCTSKNVAAGAISSEVMAKVDVTSSDNRMTPIRRWRRGEEPTV